MPPSVELPVVNTLVSPPIALLRREVIPGTFTGAGDLTRPSGPLNVDAFGISWDFFSVPAPFGYELGNPILYDNRMLQLSIIHTSTDAHEFISEYHAFNAEGIYLTWANPFPTRVHYEIIPGVVMVFFWLLV